MTIKNLLDLKVDVPVGVCGDWEIRRFNVSEDDARFGALRAAFSFNSQGRYVPSGEYTGLYKKHTVVMSDTPDEIRDHDQPIFQARGHCLVNGLGLGVVVNGMLLNNVEHVTCVEKSEDVIKLVAKHYQQKFKNKFKIIHDDALIYKPPKGIKYDYVWHDIWNDMCEDNLEEMHRLHRKYGKRAIKQGSWGRATCERALRSASR